MTDAATHDPLSEGHWMVTQVDQLVATFFLPLAEPLAVRASGPGPLSRRVPGSGSS